MARPSTIPSRKPPRQARAQVTVNAILESTVRILEQDGLEAATTTRIATVAGVSVGTLYQYFSHRDAILDALQEREFSRALEMMGGVLSHDNLTLAPRETVTAVVRGLAKLYSESPALHRVLTVEGLRVMKSDQVEAFDIRVIAIIRHFLNASRTAIRRPNVEAAAFVIFQAVRAVMLGQLLERPVGLDAETLTNEVVDLIMRYLVEDAVIEPAPVAAAKVTRKAAKKTAKKKPS
ncbi:TetR/AcrR family transcriptional regulator [Labilithrix luteola]|uniref:TetR/AcrR family transcriptional regulator n=1 Tax=Labilithrix luteola TaxID=1391654 RepID=UPI001475143C|nr:TetR/AcrR family transcriptional regulator [Labilithrix luteola]